MLRVPGGDQLGQVTPDPISTPAIGLRTDAAEFGGLRAGSLQQGARVVAGISSLLQERQREQDAVDVIDALRVGREQVNDYLHTSDDAIFKQQERDARGVTDVTSEYMDTLGQELEGELNPRAQKAFVMQWAGDIGRTLNQVSGYEARQHEVEKVNTVERSLAALLNEVSLQPSEAFAERAIQQGEGQLGAIIANEEIREEQTKQFRSDVHMSVVDSLSVANPSAALEYFDRHAKEIQGVRHAQIREQLNKGNEDRLAFDVADKAFAAGGSLEEMEQNIRDQVEAQEIDVDVGDEATRRLRDRVRTEGTSRSLEVEEGVRKARRLIYDGGSQNDLTVSEIDLLQEAGEWENLVSLEEIKSGVSPEPKTDPNVYFELTEMFGDPTRRQEYIDLDPEALYAAGLLSSADTNETIERQALLRTGGDVDKTRRSVRTQNAIQQVYLTAAGLKKPGRSPAILKQQASFVDQWEDAVDTYVENTRKQPDDAELNRIGLGLLTRLNTAGGLRDVLGFLPGVDPGDRRAFQLDLAEPILVDQAGVSVEVDAAVLGIVATGIEEANGDPTPENVRQVAIIAAAEGIPIDARSSSEDFARIWRLVAESRE